MHACGQVDISSLAAATEGYSGSDLEQLCKTAAMKPLEDLLAQEERERDAVATPAAAAATSDGDSNAAANPATAEESAAAIAPGPPLRLLTLDDFLQVH